ncbi:MAG: ankyrin repeat domain-containing protein [Methyloprofundus sp.]|nr:ankyrin repeat domain-containing protein [Methyloprofundus sp.]
MEYSKDKTNELVNLMDMGEVTKKWHKRDSAEALNLVANGANMNAQSISGWTLLMLSVKQGDIETVSALLDLGADLTLTHNNGWTAVSIAKEFGTKDVTTLVEEKIKEMEVSNIRAYSKGLEEGLTTDETVSSGFYSSS